MALPSQAPKFQDLPLVPNDQASGSQGGALLAPPPALACLVDLNCPVVGPEAHTAHIEEVGLVDLEVGDHVEPNLVIVIFVICLFE